MKLKTHIRVLAGGVTIASIEGRELEQTSIDKTIGKVIDLEQTLEKLTGYRYHITMEPVPEHSLSTIDRLLDEDRRNR